MNLRRVQWACFGISVFFVSIRFLAIFAMNLDITPQRLLVLFWLDFVVAVVGLGLQVLLIKTSE